MKKKTIAKVKKDIQAALRREVMERDGGCIFRYYPEAGPCIGRRKDGELILQADHMNTRADSTTYADPDNANCVCYGHHFFFKRKNGALFWDLVRKHIGEERWAKVMVWVRNTERPKFKLSDWLRILEVMGRSP